MTVAARYSPFAVVTALQLGHIHARLFSEGVRRGSGLPIFEGDAHRRTGYLLDDIGLGGRNVRRQHGQAARCIEIAHGACGQESFAVEQLVHALAQFQRRRVDHPRRNLFATDFE